jgi:hypothetical protein
MSGARLWDHYTNARIRGFGSCLDLDKPDSLRNRRIEDDEPEDCDCLRQKPYVDINVIPVARLEQQRINTTSNDTIVNCGTRSATNSSQGAKVDEEASAADRSLRNLLLASSWE